jgi:hypothetical protein
VTETPALLLDLAVTGAAPLSTGVVVIVDGEALAAEPLYQSDVPAGDDVIGAPSYGVRVPLRAGAQGWTVALRFGQATWDTHSDADRPRAIVRVRLSAHNMFVCVCVCVLVAVYVSCRDGRLREPVVGMGAAAAVD